MTVEATSRNKERYGLLGVRIREVEKTSVVEYRRAEITRGPVTYSEPRRPFGIDYGPRDEHGHIQLYTPKTWAWVTGENKVKVEKVQLHPFGKREVLQSVVYRGAEINSAGLVTEDGATRLTHKETQPGDYPEATLFELDDAEVIVFYEEPQVKAA